jgi:hypothetical protein
VKLLFGVKTQNIERAPAGLFGGDGIALNPAAISIAVKVVLWTNLRIYVVEVKPPSARFLLFTPIDGLVLADSNPDVKY